MSNSVHPDESALIRCLDNELAAQESAHVRAHVAICAVCRAKQDAMDALSSRVRAAVCRMPAPAMPEERARLARALEENAADVTGAGRVLRRFGWGMAIAAGLALAVVLAPLRSTRERIAPSANTTTHASVVSGLSGLNVNGETFIALPYSNPDLPLNTARIVEMQVPVAALAEAGVALQAGWNGDGMVAANVLVGIDGQPLGIDVLEAE